MRVDQFPDPMYVTFRSSGEPDEPTPFVFAQQDRALPTCCPQCYQGTCAQHRVPELIQLAARQAGCLPRLLAPARGLWTDSKPDGSALELLKRLDESHHVFVDGTDRCLHLHHGTSPHVLLIPKPTLGTPQLPDELLTWLEVLHRDWFA